MTAYLIVVAEVNESSRELFDQWYETITYLMPKKGLE